MADIKRLNNDVKDIKETVKGLPSLSDITVELDKRYAPKWVATAIVWVVGLIVGAVIMAWVSYIIVHPTPPKTNVRVSTE